MDLNDLEYFMDIARTFNNVPKDCNGLELCSFDTLPTGVEARHATDGNLQYILIDSSFNKSNYQINEIGYLMGVFVHEYRHLWQENYDETNFFLNQINQTDYDNYHENWIDHGFEQDSEAIKYLFYTEVLKCNIHKDPKFQTYDKEVKIKILALMDENKEFVNVEGSLEKIKIAKEALKKYIKYNNE